MKGENQMTIYTNVTKGITTRLIEINKGHYEIIQKELHKRIVVDNFKDAYSEYNDAIKEVYWTK